MITSDVAWGIIVDQAWIDLKKAETTKQRIEIYTCLFTFAKAMGRTEQAKTFSTIIQRLSSEDFINTNFQASAKLRNQAEQTSDEIAKKRFYNISILLAREAITSYKKGNVENPHLKAKIYLNLGASLADSWKDEKEALQNYQIALPLFEQLQLPNSVLRTQIRMGRSFLRLNDIPNASAILREIKKVSSNSLKLKWQMEIQYLEARVLLAQNNKPRAREIALSGLQIAKRLDLKNFVERFEKILSQTMSKSNFKWYCGLAIISVVAFGALKYFSKIAKT